MPLTNVAVRNAKPKDRPYKMYDSNGLYILIEPSGAKYWRVRYRVAGKERLLSAGLYPEVSLREARDVRDKIRQQVRDGIDPAEKRKALQRKLTGADSFETIAREWHKRQSKVWKEGHTTRVMRLLERDLFPWLGKRPLSEIEPPELLAALRRIESRGAVETAHRALQVCSGIFRYGVATGFASRDSAADLRGALTPVKVRHFPTITDPKTIAGLLRAMDGYQGSFVTRCALRLAPLVFVRPGELRQAEWSEIDLEAAEWRIPAAKMKREREHVVPLAKQARDILIELQPLTGHKKYLFPGLRTPTRPMSENTINGALRRLGYAQTEMTGHGFRAMASTLLNELGFRRDAIERQLAHAEGNSVRAAYNRAEHLPERREMMQAWADYLDSLRGSA